MKKIFLSVVAVFLGFIAVGQDVVGSDWKDTTKKLKYTQIGSTNNVSVQKIGNNDRQCQLVYCLFGMVYNQIDFFCFLHSFT